jgi:hypothetical protein
VHKTNRHSKRETELLTSNLMFFINAFSVEINVRVVVKNLLRLVYRLMFEVTLTDIVLTYGKTLKARTLIIHSVVCLTTSS